jgi:hypothetical protein
MDQRGGLDCTSAEHSASSLITWLTRVLAHEIAMLRFAGPEAFVTGFHLLNDFVWRHLVTLFFGEVRVGRYASDAGLDYTDSGHQSSSLAKDPAVKLTSRTVHCERCTAALLQSAF